MASAVSNRYKVSIRMYCLGTGDCFIYKFFKASKLVYTMMVDCGSCQGDRADFLPYVTDLLGYVNNNIDLLVITHEHNDHVNGFAKCKKEFADPNLIIKEAWMAWTEDPDDPEDRAKELKNKRNEMRAAFQFGMQAIRSKGKAFLDSLSNDFYQSSMLAGQAAFLNGLESSLPGEH